jgi:hypothetical protein
MHKLTETKDNSGFNTNIKLYHGSNNKFEAFDKELAGSNTGYQDADNGFYLTSNPMLAENYAVGAVGRNGGLKTVMEFYVSISNPKFYNRATDFYRELETHKANGTSLIELLKEEGMDSIIVREDMEEVIVFDSENIRPVKSFSFDEQSKNEPNKKLNSSLSKKESTFEMAL